MKLAAHNPPKTNAARLLDGLALPYELRAYEVDLNDLSAPTVAAKLDLPCEQVFKTLLCVSESNEHFFALIPGDQELDLKKFAKAAGVIKCYLAPLKEVEPLTGYLRGAVTVLAARKPFPAFADQTIELHEIISISAGLRGLQLLLTPGDFLEATPVMLTDLTRRPEHK